MINGASLTRLINRRLGRGGRGGQGPSSQVEVPFLFHFPTTTPLSCEMTAVDFRKWENAVLNHFADSSFVGAKTDARAGEVSDARRRGRSSAAGETPEGATVT